MAMNASDGSGHRGVDALESSLECSGGRWGLLVRRRRWLGFVLPFVVYMGVGAFEPIRPPPKPKPPLMPEQPGEQTALPETPPTDLNPPTPSGPPPAPSADQGAPTGGSSEGRPKSSESRVENAEGRAEKTGQPTEQSPPPEAGPGAAKPHAPKPNSRPAPAGSVLPSELPPEVNWAGIPYAAYPTVYALKILLTCLTIGLIWPVYRQFPVRMSGLAILVGMGGLIIWLGFGQLNWERKWLAPMGLGALVDMGVRSGLNPFRVFQDQPAWMLWGFVALRLFGMVVVVALVEEFFLRGFLMRYVVQANWWEVPVGQITLGALLACVLYAVLSHPGELFAATAWFLLVTWLAYRTKNIWDCVAAHAVTNALLGTYILLLAEWRYW